MDDGLLVEFFRFQNKTRIAVWPKTDSRTNYALPGNVWRRQVDYRASIVYGGQRTRSSRGWCGGSS